MKTGMIFTRSAVVAAMLAAAAVTASAQSIASRVAGVSNGTVRMSFTSRPDVCGRGNNVSTGNNRNQTISWNNNSSKDVEWEYDCERGPVRVVLDISNGNIREIRSYVGGKWRNTSESVTDLGMVPARDAADYLINLAGTLPGKPGEKAIFPAMIADSAEVWPGLIRIARDTKVSTQTRRQAVFWVSQAAGDAATKGLNDIVTDNSVDRDVREQAVFALSQRPKEQGVPALIAVARTNRDPQIRKKAMFWLGQSNDPRAIALFEEILSKQ
jgi:hypothetical protein